MAVSAPSIGRALADIVGLGGVGHDPAELASAAVEGMSPRWVVRAAGLEHVSAVLALASDEGLAVVPRGSGTALDLGHPPSRLDLVLDLTGMNRIVDYNPDDLTASVETGLTAGALASRLAARRQFLPIDPPRASARTLGGLTATAAHGPLRTRYGTLRDLVLGVRFVQADGVVTWGGARVVKSVTGYDVPKLMVGSLGTLGVLCELTVRLHPRPDVEATRLLTFEGIESAATLIAQALDSPLQPSRVELLNGGALGRLGLGGSTSVAIAMSIASVDAAVRDQVATIEDLTRRSGGESRPLPPSFWSSYDAMLADAGHLLAAHISGLPSRLVETTRAVERTLADLAPGEAAVLTGSVALGTLDLALSERALPVAGRLIERLRTALVPTGGHVMLRRAPVTLRREVDPWGPVEPNTMALMRALRDEFDPRHVLNPGRFIGGL